MSDRAVVPAHATARRTDERGFALIMTVLVVVIVGSLVAGATLIGTNHLLVNNFYDRTSQLGMVADAGLEWARARLNGTDSIYPDSGYVVIENGVTVTDGLGNTIPGVRRWIYAGPSGITSGQYGVFGSVVSVVQDAGGGRVIRRSQVYQESFSKYAYFTDIEPSSISFGGGDVIFGPVHSNSPIKIFSSGATFMGPVRTAQNVPTPQYGTFMQGYQEYVSAIPMPSTADLTKLQAQATIGGTAFVGNSSGATGEATTRIEFIAIDLNADGDQSDDNEGFIRVYQSTNAPWVTATGNEEASDQCGDVHAGVFITTNAHPGATGHSKQQALQSATRRCYLGGSDQIAGVFRATTDGYGQWLQNPAGVHPLVAALVPPRADAAYLFPITRAANPNFKGVVHVTGRVVLSGRVRGRVTVAATDDIIFGDDITYVTDPAAGTCVDMVGYFAGDDVIMANNAINAPRQIGTGSYYTLDDTRDEFIHGTVLALSIFTVQNYDTGSTNAEPCQSTTWGRGCLFLTGGIIQSTRGAVGTGSGTGNLKRYSYDACGATSPPPYFPTTGVFARGQQYQVDPVGFNIDTYFAMITP
jgi:hypothetical protein